MMDTEGRPGNPVLTSRETVFRPFSGGSYGNIQMLYRYVYIYMCIYIYVYIVQPSTIIKQHHQPTIMYRIYIYTGQSKDD